MQHLGLTPASNNLTPSTTIHLHDIENAVSNLVASLFWIGIFFFFFFFFDLRCIGHVLGTHVHPTPLDLKQVDLWNSTGVTFESPLAPPILSGGNTTITQFVSAARFDVGILSTDYDLTANLVFSPS
jgi:hypothetical protein